LTKKATDKKEQTKAVTHSLLSEKYILSAMLNDPQGCKAVIDFGLTADDFYSKRHQLIYSEILNLNKVNQAVDWGLFGEHLQEIGKLKDAGDFHYLSELMSIALFATNITHHCTIVRNYRERRKLDMAGKRLSERAKDPTVNPSQLSKQAGEYLNTIAEATGTKSELPDIFTVSKDGRCYYEIDKTNKIEAFSFDKVEYIYRLYTDELTDEGDAKCLSVFKVSGYSDTLIKFKGSELNSYPKFRDKIRESADAKGEPLECFCGDERQERVVYQAMLKHFMALQRGGTAIMIERNGLGCVTYPQEWHRFGFAIWNFGNKVLIIRKSDKGFTSEIRPFERTITITEDTERGLDSDIIIGLENFANSYSFPDFAINSNKDLKATIKQFLSFYDSGGLIGLFWIVAQANYKFFPEKQFPVLFIKGESRMGKSSMSDLLVSAYGGGGAISLTTLTKNLMAGLTPTGYLREREKIHSVPMKVDEAGKYVDRARDIIGASFDGIGKTHATKSNDLGTKDTKVNGSCILMSIEAPSNDQIYSRCVHIEIKREDIPSQEFTKFYQNRLKLSNFIPHLLGKYSPDDFNDQLIKSRKYMFELLLPYKIDSRMTQNLAFMHMGYVLCHKQDFCVELNDEFWVKLANGKSDEMHDMTDNARKLLGMAKRLTGQKYRGLWYGRVGREIHRDYELIYIVMKDESLVGELLTLLKQSDNHIEVADTYRAREILMKSRYLIRGVRGGKISPQTNWSMPIGELDSRKGAKEQHYTCYKCGFQYTLAQLPDPVLGDDPTKSKCPKCQNEIPRLPKKSTYCAKFKLPLDKSERDGDLEGDGEIMEQDMLEAPDPIETQSNAPF